MADARRWAALCDHLIHGGHMTPMAKHQILKLVAVENANIETHPFERRPNTSPRSRICKCGKTKNDLIHEVTP